MQTFDYSCDGNRLGSQLVIHCKYNKYSWKYRVEQNKYLVYVKSLYQYLLSTTLLIFQNIYQNLKNIGRPFITLFNIHAFSVDILIDF